MAKTRPGCGVFPSTRNFSAAILSSSSPPAGIRQGRGPGREKEIGSTVGVRWEHLDRRGGVRGVQPGHGGGTVALCRAMVTSGGLRGPGPDLTE